MITKYQIYDPAVPSSSAVPRELYASEEQAELAIAQLFEQARSGRICPNGVDGIWAIRKVYLTERTWAFLQQKSR